MDGNHNPYIILDKITLMQPLAPLDDEQALGFGQPNLARLQWLADDRGCNIEAVQRLIRGQNELSTVAQE